MTDQTWPYPYKPFPEPVPPVPVGSGGVTCWQFDAKWTPYILATLKTLAVPRTWESEADRAVAEARDLMGSLIESTYDCDGGEDCIDFSPRAGFIDWFPSNPFDPDAPLPDGYTTLPWVVVEDPNIFDELLSLQVGDVLALTYAPAGEKQNFVIHVNGPGTVEIHLIQKLLGGAAFIVADDNPFVAPSDVIELNRDIVSVPPELTTIFVKECTFTTAGPHTIRVSFGPRLDDSATLLGFGGGLRKIVLCGFDTEGLEMDVRQNPGLPCKLEKSFNGTTWVEFADLQNCPPKIRTDRGKTQWWNGTAWVDLDAPDERLEGEADPPYPEGEVPSGQTGNCLAAENITAFYSSALTQIRQMLGAGIVFSAIAGPLSVTMAVFMSAPVVLPAAVIIASFAALLGTIGLDDMLTGDLLEKVKCAIFCNINSDGSVTAAQYTALYNQIGAELSGTEELLTKAWLDGFGPVGLTRQGRAAGITTGDCEDCAGMCPEATIAPLAGLATIDAPLTIEPGESWTAHSINNAGQNQYLAVEFDRCIKATVVSYSGWIVNPSNTNNPAWRDCADIDHNTFGGDQPPDFLADNLECKRMYFAGHVDHPFSVTIRLDAVV